MNSIIINTFYFIENSTIKNKIIINTFQFNRNSAMNNKYFTYLYSFNKNRIKTISYVVKSNKNHICIIVSVHANSIILLCFLKICPKI